MRKLMGLLLIMLMVGFAQAEPILNNINGVQVIGGSSTAEFLNTLYNRKFPNCNNSDSQPAFLCSGVVLRTTTKDPINVYKVWDPSILSVKSGGVSFSYLRADANFGILAWGATNGYILYPPLSSPAGKTHLEYLCSYPMDAWTWQRSETVVCGPHPDYPAQSRLCQNAGVTTAQQWLDVWATPGGNPNLRQCGFDIRDERNHLAGPAFYNSLLAKTMLGVVGFKQHNEILIKTWAPGRPNMFPIMAFFYIPGGPNLGLADAQYNQLDFYNSTNPKISVPIIRMTPANAITDKATFTFVAADQAVKL
ncbi:hypothetical protein J2W43_003473 [Pseudomonas brassicacearum]|uniref:Halovibrin HvnC n=1 Tax=Pseudomonas brassicacearum TaxID=930166 RepID=A0AAW8MBQ4_9PSED|nr:halovibrin HvnC [Pseudomonas brassicacearum]MDR6959476.1 hypothetical protein [Pseudomonas brassicacearum]